MNNMYTGYVLPLTSDPWQVMTVDVCLDGVDFHAQVEVRYLPAADQWFVSIWDHAGGELLVNQIPLICSSEGLNDLLRPFRHLRGGKGLGSLFCIRGTEETSTEDPANGNINEYHLIWSDTYNGSE